MADSSGPVHVGARVGLAMVRAWDSRWRVLVLVVPKALGAALPNPGVCCAPPNGVLPKPPPNMAVVGRRL